MKLGPDVLVEIVSIVQEGIMKGEDISQRLRDIDLDLSFKATEEEPDLLKLSQNYLNSQGRT